MNKPTYKILNLTTGVTEEWTIKQVLAEINRDRSDEWTAYDETDDVAKAWETWVESESFYLKLI